MILVRRKNALLAEIAQLRATLLFYFETYQGILLRLAIIFGGLLVAPLVGIMVVKQNPLYVFILIGAPVALIALQIILPRFDLAPIIILIAAAFIPLELPTGRGSNLVDSLVLTMLYVVNWVLSMLIVEKRLHIWPSPVNKPLLIFMGITVVALIWSFIYRDPLVFVWNSFPVQQTASAIVMVMLPGAFFLMVNHVKDVKTLRIMVGLMMIAGAIAAVRRVAVDALAVVNDNGLFTMWIVSLAMGLVLFNREITWKRRSLLLTIVAAWIYFRFGRQISWLAGWLPVFIVLGILVFMRSKKYFLTAVVLVAIFVAFNASYYLGKVVEDESNESGHTRTAAWEVNWRVTGKHLLFGTGPGGYAAYYMSYYPTEGMATHSNYIDIIAQTGIFGLFFYVWFFFVLAWRGYKLCLRFKGRGDFVEALANSALAGTVGCIIIMGFGDWLIPFAYTQTIAGFDHSVYSWLFMGSILVLERLYPETSNIVDVQ